MKRLPLTLLTALALFGVYRVYALVLGPMTKLKVMPVVPPVARIEGTGHASHAARDAAREFLAEHPWAQEAKFTWEQFDQKFIYFNEVAAVAGKGQVDTKNQYRFRPFAMIVRNGSHPDDRPTVLAADEARVTFKDKIEQFGTGASGDNRIVGAELDTGVTLTGPNGLSLKGSNFVFSEATRSLYSDDPLQFTYGPTAKSLTRFVCDAEDIAITLEAGNNDILGKDLPRIADFEHLTLRRNVRFQIDYDNRGVLTPVRVSSAGSFEFNRAQRIASFERDVQVVQRTSGNDDNPLRNVLKCGRLEMQFDSSPGTPAEAAPSGKRDRKQDAWDSKMQSLAGLTLHFVVASSPARAPEKPARVRFVSDENSLVANMEQMTFDAQEGVLSLTDPAQSVIERHDPKAGTVTRLLTRRMQIGLETVESSAAALSKPTFQPVRKKFGAVDWVMCTGLGRMVHLDASSGDTLLDARWTDKLSLNPDDSTSERDAAPRLLKLLGNVQVVQGIDRSLGCDTLTLTLPPDVFDRAGGRTTRGEKTSALPIRRALAKGNVRFSALEAEGRTDSLDVLFAAGKPPVAATQKQRSQEGEPRTKRAATTTPPWDLRLCQRIDAEVIVDPRTNDAGVKTATVRGPFEIGRPELVKGATDPSNGAVTISGQRLDVTNEGDARQIVVLHGRMHGTKCVERARLRAGAAALEGQEIEFDRAQSTMHVTGQTELTWPVSGDLTGRKIAAAMLMNIGCADGLTFDGQEAHFTRSVVVRLDDESRMSCEDLLVRLNRPWSFTEQDRGPRPEVALIRSPGRVSVNMVEWEKSALSRVVVAELGAVEVHPQEGDGSFTGSGPGTIRQWQRGSFHFRVTPEASASANRPAASAELPWNFVRLDFEGKVTGNLQQQFATFDERVKAIYAPVAQAQMEFKRNELSGSSESAKRAVWVGCDQLNVSLSKAGPTAPNGFITLNALGRVELEAQKVQANAYQISFEEEKDIFELRGRGEEMASVYFESGPERGTVPGRVIQINPRTGTHRIVEAGTVTGGR